jgi:predicted nucleic acid-binding protein
MKSVFLDAGPLGLLCAPRGKNSEAAKCARWLAELLQVGNFVVVPEIADYEIRREQIRLGRTANLIRLEALGQSLNCLPLSTVAMRKAAELWALARSRGQPTGGDNTIDADVILAAQVQSSTFPNALFSTTNVAHLGRHVQSDDCRNVRAQ